ncbi:G-protein beta WD-40 repeats containing protein [Reticulomyxa filosa]|uniref:G-protein beta WD-40 repeats containing protein n=1 Tax=Reticulomyxa filosa TaxID=46433 RepID=X6P4D2_RETFI|nr:G-protein beta WD-40 repeats containing protein [Reticulomyxa filosa]|eukprot:ETO32929.1 G-protein beta WD-40 repeats containing protein [Reticulomyxa filosa]
MYVYFEQRGHVHKKEDAKRGGGALGFTLKKCLDKRWIQALNKADKLKHFVCTVCGQIAYPPVQLTCREHEGIAVGEHCIKQYIQANDGKCPIDQHGHCTYVNIKVLRNQVDSLKVICPRHYQLNVQNAYQQQKGEGEGETTLPTNGEKVMECAFKGELRQMQDHLDNHCHLKLLDCPFKPFGYAFEFDCQFSAIIEYCNTTERYGNYSTQTIQVEIHSGPPPPSPSFIIPNCVCSINNTQKVNTKKIFKKKKKQEFFVFIMCMPICQQLIVQVPELKQGVEQNDEQIEMEEEVIAEKNQQILLLQMQVEALNEQLKYQQTQIEELKKEEQKYHQQTGDEQKNNTTNNSTKNTFVSISNFVKFFSFFFFSSSSSSLSFRSFVAIKRLRNFDGHEGAVYSAQLSPFDGGRTICSASSDKTIRIWDTQSTKQLQILRGHTEWVSCALFSPFHHYLSSSTRKNDSGNPDHDNHPGDSRRLSSVICSASGDHTIRFWDIATANELQCLKGHKDTIRSIDFSPFFSGRFLCSGSRDNTIRLWDAANYKMLNTFNGHTNWVNCTKFSNSKTIHDFSDVGQSNNNTIRVIGGSGYTICSGSSDLTVRVWDIQTTKPVSVFRGHENAVKCVEYSPSYITSNSSSPSLSAVGSAFSSNLICSGSSDNTVRLWDIRTNKQTHIFSGHMHAVYCVQFSPVLNFNDTSNSTKSWFNFLNSAGNTTPPSPPSPSPSSSSTGYVICSGSCDKTIRFWDIRTTKELFVLNGHESSIYSLQFAQLQTSITADTNSKNNESDDTSNTVASSSQHVLCSASHDKTICLWG